MALSNTYALDHINSRCFDIYLIIILLFKTKNDLILMFDVPILPGRTSAYIKHKTFTIQSKS